MASAVDSRRPTSSPTANSATPRRGSSRKNPLAHEIAVIATGARPGDGHRELFTEETSTGLVFEDGAVIRLSAAVANGQLVFLTHKESRREVVAQVARKREFRPTSCYVEVEFSEPAPGFWGIDFSQEAAHVPFDDQQQAAAELVQGSRTVSDNSKRPALAPSTEDVDTLKKEVEALRRQVQSLKTQAVEPKSATWKSAAPSAPASVPAPSATSSAQSAPFPPPVTSAVTPPPVSATLSTPTPKESYSTESQGAFSSLSSPTPSYVSPSLPTEHAASTTLEEATFPRPEIRVNRSKNLLPTAGKYKVAARGSFRPEVVRVAAISAALLVVALVVGVYLHWIPLPDFAKSIVPGSTAASSAPRVSPSATVSSNPSQPAGGTSSPQAASTVSNSLQPSALATSRPAGSAPVYSSEASDSDIRVIEVVPDSGVKPQPAVVKRAVTSSRTRTARASSEPMAVVGGGPVTPPKLVKSFRAVASPSNLEYFDKSNTVTVVLDGIVDTSGHVNSMSVVSGPASLRAAAMSALQLYEYTPARQNGRAVAAHVTVTIKFLFEP